MSVTFRLCIWTGDESSKLFAVQEQVRYIADTVPLQVSRDVDSVSVCVCVLCVACGRFTSMLLSVLTTVGEIPLHENNNRSAKTNTFSHFIHQIKCTSNTSNKVLLWFKFKSTNGLYLIM